MCCLVQVGWQGTYEASKFEVLSSGQKSEELSFVERVATPDPLKYPKNDPQNIPNVVMGSSWGGGGGPFFRSFRGSGTLGFLCALKMVVKRRRVQGMEPGTTKAIFT